ncbi:hypothetical protein PF005_g1654 [Phytophthora fragariae]|uniref:Protein kinase domain-containing protein n=1 Tax=Phytophthora fragariae TaxID=53985 RepID=A0A6A3LQ96_9STRA|nr:hypothetical protein PF003_g35114 [Phytophthora fragariae]KAE8948708.1 hypothetical protein PF009_g1710 [Phytophthora fragariae]KAE9021751.1 hypothetical protein PF011_g4795 [Phytophthora fragariae]KAE9128955.1 hypothetical protein PF007_g5087 [Phytophthora fragariae]KAE9138352.1 hypothetical protein PF010_g988 [Phytophthora fragariae]
MLSEGYLKHYDTPKDCTASSGHELSWKIIPVVHRMTNHEYSVFLFDKDNLKRLKSKEAQDRVIEVLRQEMKTLRVLRHPHVLKVEEVFEESRRSLCFVTEEAQDRVLEVLRQEMKTLRVLRHPHVLKVEEVFGESRRSLCFVTERVTCSLANACKSFTNIVPDHRGRVGRLHIRRTHTCRWRHRQGQRYCWSRGRESRASSVRNCR